jgi:hypothetical protein
MSFSYVTSGERRKRPVRWQPAAGAIGTAVELQLEDGGYRTIGVAGGTTASARFSLAGLQVSAVRLRASNTGGYPRLRDRSRSLCRANMPFVE